MRDTYQHRHLLQGVMLAVFPTSITHQRCSGLQDTECHKGVRRSDSHGNGFVSSKT